MNLPQFQNDDRPFQLLQNKWASILNPVIANPLNNCSILKGVALTAGANVINHLLGKKLQGWALVRQRAAGSVYDTQDANSSPQLTLTLVSSSNMTVDIMVF